MTNEEIEKILVNAGCTYDHPNDQWRYGDDIIEFRNGKWCITMTFEDPIHGEGDDLAEMLEDAQQSLKKIYNYNKKMLKLVSLDFNVKKKEE